MEINRLFPIPCFFHTGSSKKNMEALLLLLQLVLFHVCVFPVFCYWEGAVLQLFEWPYDDIATECPGLATDGWKAVQVSPVHSHRSLPPLEGIASATGETISYPWWERYQPISYNLTSRSGDVEALRRAVEKCADVGIQIIADVVLNNLAAFQCCDTDAADHFRIVPCRPEQKIYDPKARAYADAMDYIPPSDIDPVKIKDCSLLGLPDLKTASPNVRSLQRRVIRELLELGISGFRVDAAKHMWDEDLEELFGLNDCTLKAPVVRADIVARTSAGVSFPPCTDKARPRLLLEVSDPRPKAGLRYTDYSRLGQVTFFDWSERITGLTLCHRTRLAQGQHPSECPPLKYLPQYLSPPAMLPFSGRANFLAYDSALLFVTNHDNERLQFMHRPPIACKLPNAELRLGKASASPEISSRIHLGIAFSDLSSTRLSKMTLRESADTDFGDSQIQRKKHENITLLDACELDALTSYNHPNLWALANVFTLAMPYGTPRVLSSYEWSRQYIRLPDGRIEETHGWVGPPRTDVGGTQRVTCMDYDEIDTGGNPLKWQDIRSRLRGWDMTPTFHDDGLHFNCEHKLPMIGNMAGWRAELRDHVSLHNVNQYMPLHPKHGRPGVEKNLLSFGRGNDQPPWNKGWLVVNFGQEAAMRYNFDTQLPPGVYCNLALARWGSRGCGKAYALVYVDVQGRIKDMTVPEESAVILHTSAAYLSTSVMSNTGVMTLFCFHLLIPMVVLLVAHCRRMANVVVVSGPVERSARPSSLPPPVTRYNIFISGIEHQIPDKGVSVNAGGLGKVIGIMLRHHPGDMVFVFPSAGGVEYGPDWRLDPYCPTVKVTVEGTNVCTSSL
ncbi:unnamed protein product [Vitrella brassicaformis CCMP3155]|uniref:Alpha-amylase n=2 Tax=Vitrella brassicaformis TaxID=1169539 RepID=A0A0G4FQS3_VITBC|nr:unnamed protein product [Vitrella brassicaformis CCMP3155]|eukprot:CEM16802.1 unnamed protein product [Vitrella brassicaformis CCMP3155]